MIDFDVNQVKIVTGDSATYAVYNDVYYKINDSAKVVIMSLQNGCSTKEVASNYSVSEHDIDKLIETFQKKKKGSLFGRIVLFPKKACNFFGYLLQHIICNRIMIIILLIYIACCFYVFKNYVFLESLSIYQTFFIFFIILFLHELGHIAAAYKRGIKDLQIRIGFYLIFPVTHVDMNSVYTLTSRERLHIDIGGLYFQMLLGIAIYLFLLNSGNPLYLLAFSENLMVIIFNLIPYQISDGHWIYSDYFGIENLNSLSKEFVRTAFRFKRENEYSAYSLPVKIYAIFNLIIVSLLIVYSIVVLVLRPFTFSQIFDNLINSNFSFTDILKVCWLIYPYCILLFFLFVKIHEYYNNVRKCNK